MNENKLPLTTVILTQNNEAVIERAIQSIDFCDEILLVDNRSTDKTVKIATALGAKVTIVNEGSFAQKRNLGLEKVINSWVFYLDSDEVVSDKLAKEIEEVVLSNIPGVYKVQRQNIFLGREMYPDAVERLFHKDKLHNWTGKVHEHPIYDGEIQTLTNHLTHYTHTDITSMLTKTNNWSEIESELRLNAKHPPVKWWRLVRIALTVWWEQGFHKKIWKYGREGWFEGYFQMIDKLIVYTKLWEKQNKDSG